jgi:3-hydroxybutyryl-CoA dehydrogenase
MEIRTLGVLGCGTMGTGIAQVAARAGIPTILAKATPGPVDAARGRIEKALRRDVDKGRLTEDQLNDTLGQLTVTDKLHELSACDLIVESIVEDADTKIEAFQRLDEIVGDKAIFATNTSTLCVTELMTRVRRTDRFVGLHFFNPVPAMKLVEIIPTLQTAPPVEGALVKFTEALGKTPVVVQDATGFIVNRLLVPYLVDAIECLQRGLGTIQDIDSAMQLGAAHPMGPLSLSDFIGLDIVFHMASNLHAEFREPRFAPSPLLRRMVLAGMLGRKSGKGFYDYSQKPPRPNDWITRADTR